MRLHDELAAAKALASQAIRESDEQRGRLDRQASSLAAEGEEMRRALQKAVRAERQAAAELASLRARVDQTAAGGAVDAVRAGLERDAAQREMGELRAVLESTEERHAAELVQLRAQTTVAEERRLKQQEAAAGMARDLANVRRSPILHLTLHLAPRQTAHLAYHT